MPDKKELAYTIENPWYKERYQHYKYAAKYHDERARKYRDYDYALEREVVRSLGIDPSSVDYEIDWNEKQVIIKEIE